MITTRIALSDDEWRKVRAAAALDGMTVQEWLAQLVRAFVDRPLSVRGES